MSEQRFSGVAQAGPRGSVRIALPFDPHSVWGAKPKHHVSGTINGMRFRAEVSGGAIVMGPAWLRDCPVSDGEAVAVVLSAEGPQRGALDPDIAAALEAEPAAGAFFDGLAQFYRKGYLTWIAGTKKRPDERARRIAEMVRLLKAGRKQRD